MIQVEIWSDVLCPFCYIGKKKFEAALQAFSGKDSVEVVWRSFQLEPDSPVFGQQTPENYTQHLATKKGMTAAQVNAMFETVAAMGSAVGLTLDFEKAVIANSFDAHRLTHLAANYGKKAAAKEALFKAHFTLGLDIGAPSVLLKIGEQLGLPHAEVKAMLTGELYKEAVKKDLTEAERLGISSVPFFVFNRRFAVSGAQDSATFLDALQRSR